MVYAYDEILLGIKKDGNSDTYITRMMLESIMLSAISQLQPDNYCMIPLT